MSKLINVKSVSKVFSRDTEDLKLRLRRDLKNAMLPYFAENTYGDNKSDFFALNDISFSVTRGETLGVIGLNGSGKSTLLRLLSKQLTPDIGNIEAVGSILEMIDLTGGFNMSASGAENVFIKCKQLGISKDEIENHYVEIVEFAELENEITAPVNTYSSGMLMRLAISILLSMKPDIILIDEVLAVGDFLFKQKCLNKLDNLRKNAAVVVVSHSMEMIKLFCDRVIVLEKGVAIFEGSAEDAVAIYEDISLKSKNFNEFMNVNTVRLPYINHKKAIKIVKSQWTDEHGSPISKVEQFGTLIYSLSFETYINYKKLIVGVPIWNSKGILVTALSTKRDGSPFLDSSSSSFNVKFHIGKVICNPGVYISNLAIHDGPKYLFRGENPDIEVVPSTNNHWGLFTTEFEVQISRRDDCHD